MPTITNPNGKSFVRFSFNGGDETKIIASYYINADDKFYGAQFIQSKRFGTKAGAVRWAKKQVAA